MTSPDPVRSITEELDALATATAVPEANDIEAWLERHFVSASFTTRLYVWRAVLTRAGSPAGGPYPLVPPPEAVWPAVELVAQSRPEQWASIVAAHAPAATAAERQLGLDQSADATTALEIAESEETWRAIEPLSRLDAPERRVALVWAQEQAVALDLPPERLGPDIPSAHDDDGPTPIRLAV